MSNTDPMIDARHRLAEALAAIVESSQDAIFRKSLDGVIESWNSGAESMYGYRPEEIIGRPVSTLAPPEREDEIKHILERLARGERVEHFETNRVTKDGRIIDVSLSISPVRDDTGRIVGAATIARDITQQRLAERDLRIARQQLGIITQAGADGITIQDATGRLVYANDSAARMSGYSDAASFIAAPLEEVLGRFDLLHEDGRPFSPEELPGRRILRGEEHAEALIRVLVRQTGEENWTLVRAAPMQDEDGTVHHVVNVFHHITEQKRAEQQLKFQNALLEAQSEASEVGIVVISPEGEIVSANRRFGELWGIPQEVLNAKVNEGTMEVVKGQVADPESFVERSRYLWDHLDAEARDEIALKDGRVIERYTRTLKEETGAT